MSLWALAAGLGFALGVPLTAAAHPLARRAGQIDLPAGHKRHAHPVPVAGGVAVFWAVALPAVILLLLGADSLSKSLRVPAGEAWAVLLGSSLLHVLGVCDDRVGLRPLPKLVAQIAAVLPLVLAFDVRLLPLWLPPPASIALSVLWFLTIINAFNFLDGLDGLLGSVGSICALLLGAAAVVSGQFEIAWLLGLLTGALLGFLIFNYPPASIFMGDGGSLVVGYLLAYASVEITYSPRGVAEAAPWYAVLTPLVVLAIPLYDLVSVVLLRLRQLKSPVEADLQHFSHRLQRRGMSARKVLVVISACTLATGMGGLMLIRLEAWQAILVAAQTITILLVLALLESAPEPGRASRR